MHHAPCDFPQNRLYGVLSCILPYAFYHVQTETDSTLLSSLRFKIKDDEIGRDALAAWACIRLDRLREGYRLIHFHDYAGEKAGGILLVNIVKRVT